MIRLVQYCLIGLGVLMLLGIVPSVFESIQGGDRGTAAQQTPNQTTNPDCYYLTHQQRAFTPGCRFEDQSTEEQIRILNERQRAIERCLAQGKTPRIPPYDSPFIWCT